MSEGINNLTVYHFQGTQVRTVNIDGEPWWVLKDVCDVLGIANSRDTADRLEDDEKNTVALNDGIPGNPNKTIINESGLYAVILRSDKPSAREFRKWVTSEVLPSIRKTGGYQIPKGMDLIAMAVLEAEKIIKAKEAKIAELEPKAEFFDQVASSKTALQMRDVAAALNAPGWGRNKLFAYLRVQGILDDRNVPYRQYQDAGYFRVVEQTYTDKEGETHISLKTLVYQRGLDYIRKAIMAGKNQMKVQL